MKIQCEVCTRPLPPEVEAYICSYNCTFCPDCAIAGQDICRHCGGELVPRPRRRKSTAIEERTEEEQTEKVDTRNNAGLIWAASFGIWTFVSLAATATIYELYRPANGGAHLGTIAGMEFSQILTYAPLTPFAFAFASRYPIQRENWVRRSLFHLAAGLVFTLLHISFRAATPYGYWDPEHRQWSSAIWNSYNHTFREPWVVLKSMFFSSVVDDITGAYISIVLVAHAISYYRRLQERELLASKLESQLAKAHLQTL